MITLNYQTQINRNWFNIWHCMYRRILKLMSLLIITYREIVMLWMLQLIIMGANFKIGVSYTFCCWCV